MKGLTFILTDKCNITCDFCAPNCGPKLQGSLSSESMIRVYDQLSALTPVANVVFTGGEPTLFLKDILEVIRHIQKDGTSSRIVTNAYWGKSEKLARRYVGELREAGLSEFNFSVDDFHQEYIPYSSIETAVIVALEYEFPVLLAHKTYPESKSDLSTFESLLKRKIPVYENLTDEEKDTELLCFSSGYTIPVGRGADEIEFDKWVRDDVGKDRWKGPCNEVLKNITIQSDGSLSPCCGLVDRSLRVFYSGSIYQDSMKTILERANGSALYNWLALEGPEGLKNAIEERNSEETFDGKYLQNCQLCQEIFSSESKMQALVESIPEKMHSVSIQRLGHEVMRTTCKF